MPRSIPASAIAAGNAQQTSEVYIVLLTIDHASGTIYLTSDSVDTISNGNTFLPLPFDLNLPSMQDGQISEAELTIDNVDRQLIAEIRTQNVPLEVSLDVVLFSDPDTALVSFTEFSLRNISYDEISISGRLTMEDYLVEPFPKDRMTAQFFPGLFFR